MEGRVLIEATVAARVLGVRLLTLDARVVTTPVEGAVPPHVPLPAARAGASLGGATRLLDENAARLAAANGARGGGAAPAA